MTNIINKSRMVIHRVHHVEVKGTTPSPIHDEWVAMCGIRVKKYNYAATKRRVNCARCLDNMEWDGIKNE